MSSAQFHLTRVTLLLRHVTSVVSSGLKQMRVHAMIDTELSSVTLGHFCQISVHSNACISPVSLLVAVFNCLVQDSFSLRHNKWSSMCDKNHSFLLSQVGVFINILQQCVLVKLISCFTTEV
jgi:hypothetical protein